MTCAANRRCETSNRKRPSEESLYERFMYDGIYPECKESVATRHATVIFLVLPSRSVAIYQLPWDSYRGFPLEQWQVRPGSSCSCCPHPSCARDFSLERQFYHLASRRLRNGDAGCCLWCSAGLDINTLAVIWQTRITPSIRLLHHHQDSPSHRFKPLW